jgi:hypothetical protein
MMSESTFKIVHSSANGLSQAPTVRWRMENPVTGLMLRDGSGVSDVLKRDAGYAGQMMGRPT